MLVKAVVSAVLATAAAAQAGLPETSPRPVLRPGSGASSVVSVDPPLSSLRPIARPSTAAEAGVSTGHAGFDQWIGGFRGRALEEGVAPDVYDAAMASVRYNATVVRNDRNQAEFSSQIWDYLDNVVSPPRMRMGREMLRRHADVLGRIEERYGVDRKVVVAVWGLESQYGQRRGAIPVVEALATLAFDGRRGQFFETQLIAALKILQAGDVQLRDFRGSWAGAMGHTQFMPTSFEAYAVDFTGDGRRDIWSDNPVDALASAAAYLNRFGWRAGQPWGLEVSVPADFASRNATEEDRRLPSQWARAGVRAIGGGATPDHGKAWILMPAGKAGPAFMIFDNFGVIKRYNNSTAYALGIGLLSDRIGGGAPLRGTWPRGYEPLSFEEREELQRRLMARGFDIEKIDGMIGSNTRGAIRAFQRSEGLDEDGLPSKSVLERLRGG